VPHLTNQRFVSLSIKDELKQKINIKFLFYYFYLLDDWCLKNTTKSSFATVDMVGFRKFPIPIPPLAEQNRIVSILDKFDALVSDISNGLLSELNARRQQYEYYRNKLLTFKEYVR
jgi:type I restriction enzyme S subunit